MGITPLSYLYSYYSHLNYTFFFPHELFAEWENLENIYIQQLCQIFPIKVTYILKRKPVMRNLLFLGAARLLLIYYRYTKEKNPIIYYFKIDNCTSSTYIFLQKQTTIFILYYYKYI